MTAPQVGARAPGRAARPNGADRASSTAEPRPRPQSRHGARPGPASREAGQLVVAGTEAMSRATPEATRDALAFRPAHFEQLDLISSGVPTPNAVAIIAAARLRLDFLLARPDQKLNVDSRVIVNLVNPFAPRDAGDQAVTARPLFPTAAGQSHAELAEHQAQLVEATVLAARAQE